MAGNGTGLDIHQEGRAPGTVKLAEMPLHKKYRRASPMHAHRGAETLKRAAARGQPRGQIKQKKRHRVGSFTISFGGDRGI